MPTDSDTSTTSADEATLNTDLDTSQDTLDQTPDSDADTSADTGGSSDNSDNAQHTPETSEHTDDTLAGEAETGADAPEQETPTAPPEMLAIQKRYDDLRSSVDGRIGKVTHENRTLQQQLAKFQQEDARRREAEQAKTLDPWSKKHPENAKFTGLKGRAKNIRESIKNLKFPDGTDPAAIQAAKQSLVNQLSPEEWTSLDGYEQKLRERNEQLLEDPESFFEPMAERIAQRVLQQAQKNFEVDSAVDQDFNDPELKPLIEQYGAEFTTALADGVPYKYAVHQMRLFHAFNQLQAQQGKLTKGSQQARAQQVMAKQNASITRDPKPARNVDPYGITKKWAIAEGIEIGGDRFNQKLRENEKKFSNS